MGRGGTSLTVCWGGGGQPSLVQGYGGCLRKQRLLHIVMGRTEMGLPVEGGLHESQRRWDAKVGVGPEKVGQEGPGVLLSS